MDLNGTTAGTSYDQVVSSGAVNLSASPTLNISVGYTPFINDSYTILTGTSITGTFAGKSDGSTFVVDGQKFRINYNPSGAPTSVVLTALGSVVNGAYGTSNGNLVLTRVYRIYHREFHYRIRDSRHDVYNLA